MGNTAEMTDNCIKILKFREREPFKHTCSFGGMNKKENDRLKEIMGVKTPFVKCKCGKVVPFLPKDLLECPGKKILSVAEALREMGYRLSTPTY